MFDYDFISASALRSNFADALSQLYYGQNRFLITRRDKVIGALMTHGDFQKIEELSRESEESKRLRMERAYESWQRAKRRGRQKGNVLILPKS